MKVTQNPETGKLIIDGEGETVYLSKVVDGNNPVEMVRNFHFDYKPEGDTLRFYPFQVPKKTRYNPV